MVRLLADGGYQLNFGPTVQDGVTGKLFPGYFAMTQRGVTIDRRWSRGARDKPDTY